MARPMQHSNVDSRVTIELEGQEQFAMNLAEVEQDYIRGFEKAVKRGATRLVRQAKTKAPKGPTRKIKGKIRPGGTLRARIRSRDVSRQIGLPYRLAKTVASRAPHRHLVQEGTGRRTTRKTGANRGVMPANDFMERSIRHVHPKYLLEMRAAINERREI